MIDGDSFSHLEYQGNWTSLEDQDLMEMSSFLENGIQNFCTVKLFNLCRPQVKLHLVAFLTRSQQESIERSNIFKITPQSSQNIPNKALKQKRSRNQKPNNFTKKKKKTPAFRTQRPL